MIPLQDVNVIVLCIVIYGHINLQHDSVTRRPSDGFACSKIYGHINFKHDSVTRCPCDGFSCSDIWSHKLHT